MIKQFLLLSAVFIGLFTANSAFSQDTTVVLSADMFDEFQIIHLGNLDGWVFRPGHDPAWADPDLDTSDWEVMKPFELTTDHADESGLIEGWFRLRFKMDSTLTDIPLAWRSGTFGAKELYLDGEKVISFGTPNSDRRLHKSYIPWLKLSDPANLEIGREYSLAFYLTDHHSARIDRIKLFGIDVDPALRLTGPELTSYVYSVAQTLRSFNVLWISVLFLLTFLFWVISFQSAGEYIFRLIAWIITFFLINALTQFIGTFIVRNLVQIQLMSLVFELSALMVIGLIPMIVSQIFKGSVSNGLKVFLGILIAVAILSYLTGSSIPTAISLLVAIGIATKYVRYSWGNIHDSQWMVLGGLALSILWILLWLLYYIMAPDYSEMVYNYIVTASYLTFPISLLLFISFRYKEILAEIQNNAEEVVRLTNEKLESEKEKQRIAANQKKVLEQEVEKRTRELRESLDSLNATQDQLVQQEKLASLGQLTAGIAHEIKNPLNFVNNFSEVSLELIEEAREEVRQATNDREPDSEKAPKGRDWEQHPTKGKTDLSSPPGRGAGGEGEKGEIFNQILHILDDIEANLRKIHEHGSRADGIVKSMLLHSRGGTGEMAPELLNPFIKEYVNLAFHGMRAGKDPINVDIQLDLDENIGEVHLIAEDFSRVILNLCNNAFDAMREKALTPPFGHPSPWGRGAGGEGEYSPKLTVRTKSDNGKVLIEIEDNGPGIPDEIKDKILQPFFTTKKGTQGTGLGLSISHDIVKAHGGELSLESVAGKGTVFTIVLPNKQDT